MSARVVWISFAPVKGLRVRQLEEAQLTVDGIPGDRAFFLVDARGTMVNAKRIGALVTVIADHDPVVGRLSLRFPDGRQVTGAVELGEPEQVRFFGLTLDARPLAGAFSGALSAHAGQPLRLVAAPPQRSGVDRGRDGAVTLLSTGSLERLRQQSGGEAPVDARRFRMTLGVEGVAAHAEDGWLDRRVRVGEALLRVTGHVGRCAVTTRNAETGAVDFPTLRLLQAYRGEQESTEPLPFGVHARVMKPGRVRLGDAVEPVD